MKIEDKIRILIGDDDVLFRLGLMEVLEQQPDMTVVAEASDARTALKLCAEDRPDIALLDVHLPALREIEAIKLLRAKLQPVHVIVLARTVQADELLQALVAGAHGYFPKSMRQEDLLGAIRSVHHGGIWIPPGVAACLAERLSAADLSSCEADILRLLPRSASCHESGKAAVLPDEATYASGQAPFSDLRGKFSDTERHKSLPCI